MNTFQKRTAVQIALVSVLLASVASSLSWFAARERAEGSVLELAVEESGLWLRHHNAGDLSGPDAEKRAQAAAGTITGGLFDIVEIYDRSGRRLAESMTAEGAAIESSLPRHVRPRSADATYESLKVAGDHWVLRVFVPLSDPAAASGAAVSGYLEGVRVVPQWQRDQILSSALASAVAVFLASLLCGAVIYPVVVHLSADNERKAREVLDSHISMMEALGRAIARRDSDTGAHNFRVAWIAARVGEHLGLRGGDMQALIVGSFLHDVGKIGIPDAILLKPGRLDPDELEIMRTHVAQGELIVGGMGWLEGAQAVVSAHHEKWDGSGYPRGLAGEAIPLAARIFAVADVFDALCSKRPYKEPMSFEEAMAILHRDTGSHFDPRVMDAFRPLAEDIFTSLAGADEAQARGLLEARIRQHFEAMA